MTGTALVLATADCSNWPFSFSFSSDSSDTAAVAKGISTSQGLNCNGTDAKRYAVSKYQQVAREASCLHFGDWDHPSRRTNHLPCDRLYPLAIQCGDDGSTDPLGIHLQLLLLLFIHFISIEDSTEGLGLGPSQEHMLHGNI